MLTHVPKKPDSRFNDSCTKRFCNIVDSLFSCVFCVYRLRVNVCKKTVYFSLINFLRNVLYLFYQLYDKSKVLISSILVVHILCSTRYIDCVGLIKFHNQNAAFALVK